MFWNEFLLANWIVLNLGLECFGGCETIGGDLIVEVEAVGRGPRPPDQSVVDR